MRQFKKYTQHIITMAKQRGTNHLARDEEKMITLLLNIYHQSLYADYIRVYPFATFNHDEWGSGPILYHIFICSIISASCLWTAVKQILKVSIGTPCTRKSLVKGERFVRSVQKA